MEVGLRWEGVALGVEVALAGWAKAGEAMMEDKQKRKESERVLAAITARIMEKETKRLERDFDNWVTRITPAKEG